MVNVGDLTLAQLTQVMGLLQETSRSPDATPSTALVAATGDSTGVTQNTTTPPPDDEQVARLLSLLANVRFISPAITMRANLKYIDHLALLTRESKNRGTAVSDCGADCVVGGFGWQVVYLTGRKANIIGFDAQAARKDGLAIGSGITAVDLKTEPGKTVFLVANEMVFNTSSFITLLSEYQIREYGGVIDSVASHHKRSQKTNDYGTQCFQPNKVVIIPFKNNGALMTFDTREPTMKEMESFHAKTLPNVITITSDKPWVPDEARDIPKVSALKSVMDSLRVKAILAAAREAVELATSVDHDGFVETVSDDESVDNETNAPVLIAETVTEPSIMPNLNPSVHDNTIYYDAEDYTTV
jgi:hypothetical protein